MRNIPLSVPNVCGNEVKYVSETLADGWISAVGPYVSKFEEAMANYIGVEDAVAVASGTAALHLAYMEAGVEEGDAVITQSLTFIATINPIAYLKAKPYFLDVDDSLCLSAKALEEFLETKCEMRNGTTYIKETNERVKVVSVVDVFGNLADFEHINPIAKKWNLTVVEDAAEAVGTYKLREDGTKQFAGTFSDIGIYSFNGNKIMSTGGGGMIFAKDQKALEHMRHLSTQAKEDTWYFFHDEVGYNYRLSNLAGAVGVAQLENLEKFVKRKEELYNLYKNRFAKAGIKLVPFRDDIRPNRWFFSVLWEPEYPVSRDDVMHILKDKGIGTRPIWGLNSAQKPYKECGHDGLGTTKYYYDRVINIPCSTNLSDEDANYVADEIIKLKEGK